MNFEMILEYLKSIDRWTICFMNLKIVFVIHFTLGLARLGNYDPGNNYFLSVCLIALGLGFFFLIEALNKLENILRVIEEDLASEETEPMSPIETGVWRRSNSTTYYSAEGGLESPLSPDLDPEEAQVITEVQIHREVTRLNLAGLNLDLIPSDEMHAGASSLCSPLVDARGSIAVSSCDSVCSSKRAASNMEIGQKRKEE